MAIPIIGGILDLIKGPLEKLIPDKNKRMEFEHEITKGFLSSDLAQMDVNKQEAAHKSLFVAGWRPAVGWTCAIALAYNFLLYPTLLWGTAIWAPDITPPVLNTDTLETILMGMLGLGGLRTIEKLKGASREK